MRVMTGARFLALTEADPDRPVVITAPCDEAQGAAVNAAIAP